MQIKTNSLYQFFFCFQTFLHLFISDIIEGSSFTDKDPTCKS